MQFANLSTALKSIEITKKTYIYLEKRIQNMSLNKETNPCDYCECLEANKCEETIEEDHDGTSQEEEASSHEEEEEEEASGHEEEKEEIIDAGDNIFHVVTCITFALPCIVFLLNIVQLDDDYLWNITS